MGIKFYQNVAYVDVTDNSLIVIQYMNIASLLNVIEYNEV